MQGLLLRSTPSVSFRPHLRARARCATRVHAASKGGQQASQQVKVQFSVPHKVEFGEALCIVGSDELGGWSPEVCTALQWTEGDVWVSDELDIECGKALEYKVVITATDGSIRQWQPGENARLEVPTAAAAPALVKVGVDWEAGTQSVDLAEADAPQPAASAPMSSNTPAPEVSTPTPAAEAASVPETRTAAPAQDSGPAASTSKGAYAEEVAGANASPTVASNTAGEPEASTAQHSASAQSNGKALLDMTVAELKVLLKERGLKQSGKKAELISRLEEGQ